MDPPPNVKRQPDLYSFIARDHAARPFSDRFSRGHS